MNLYMSRAEYESLPFRDALKNEPMPGALFRAKAHPGNVFKALVSDTAYRLIAWDCFKVDFE